MSGQRLDWFKVAGPRDFLIGERMRVTGVGEGYERALSHARDMIARPHDPAPRDLLTAECNEFAEMLHTIVHEDGNTFGIADVLGAFILETARRESDMSGEAR